MTEPFVRPDVRTFLDTLNSLNGPKSHEVGAEQARGMMHASRKLFDAEVGELAVVRDLTGGPCPMRLFDAQAERGPGPVLVFYHGGGFVLGDLDTHAPACAEIARLTDLPVVSVDYRLAPEHPFPAGVEDAIAATRWVGGSPAELERQATGLIPCGDSAGGNFAIVVSLALRDEPAAVPVLAQWPIYPAANPTEGYPSFTDFGEGYLLTRDGMNWFDQCYAPDAKDWRYDPLHQNQRGMPPTLVVTASLDPIRDQGRAYAAACAAAGVSVVYLEAEGTIHGFLNLRKALPSAQTDLERCVAHLKLLLQA
jgi:acetyl esterase